MSDYVTHTAYCSACDRPVTVGLKPGYVVVPGAEIDPGAVVCHGVGDWCTGEMCPLFGVEPAEMKERLATLPRMP